MNEVDKTEGYVSTDTVGTVRNSRGFVVWSKTYLIYNNQKGKWELLHGEKKKVLYSKKKTWKGEVEYAVPYNSVIKVIENYKSRYFVVTPNGLEEVKPETAKRKFEEGLHRITEYKYKLEHGDVKIEWSMYKVGPPVMGRSWFDDTEITKVLKQIRMPVMKSVRNSLDYLLSMFGDNVESIPAEKLNKLVENGQINEVYSILYDYKDTVWRLKSLMRRNKLSSTEYNRFKNMVEEIKSNIDNPKNSEPYSRRWLKG